MARGRELGSSGAEQFPHFLLGLLAVTASVNQVADQGRGHRAAEGTGAYNGDNWEYLSEEASK